MRYTYCSSRIFYILYVYIQNIFGFQLRNMIWKLRSFSLIASMCQAWLHFICLKNWLGLVYFPVYITIFSCSTHFCRDKLEHSNPLIYYKCWFILCYIISFSISVNNSSADQMKISKEEEALQTICRQQLFRSFWADQCSSEDLEGPQHSNYY